MGLIRTKIDKSNVIRKCGVSLKIKVVGGSGVKYMECVLIGCIALMNGYI